MRTPFLVLRFALLAGAAWPAALAQAPAPAAPIAADSLLLYRLFFRFHRDFDQWLAARKTALPASAAALDSGAGALLGVKAADLSALSSVSQSVAAEIEKVDREEAAYLNLAARREQKPDPALVNQYRQRRKAAAAAGMAALRQRLPLDSYAGLLGFLNGRFRTAWRTAAQP